MNSNCQKDDNVNQMVFSHLSMVQKTTGISQHSSENYRFSKSSHTHDHAFSLCDIRNTTTGYYEAGLWGGVIPSAVPVLLEMLTA
jgi:hypothetical protein